ncbi:MAG: DedA family protein [Actinobacteria bacterium]|nr:MAG: DedA family protein [Actinomycetota bacterium]
MKTLISLLNIFLHIDKQLGSLTNEYGLWIYLILFIVIFCETGLIVTPFLPGDSLLFAAGAIAAIGSLNISWLFFLLFLAAVLGDTVNYTIGNLFGQRILENKKIPFIKQKHLEKTNKFFEKHGKKTIIIARFVPIVRTFAPFIAGVGKMNYGQFLSFNVVGGFVWISLFTFGGYFFGNISFVKSNFSLIVVVIILISVVPIALELLKKKS